ncbi:hypothetical protein AB0H28_16940 [Micromonospora sp. NPDC050980]
MENARDTCRGPDFEQLSTVGPEIAGRPTADLTGLVAAFLAYPRG